jgi:hypothetical protein
VFYSESNSDSSPSGTVLTHRHFLILVRVTSLIFISLTSCDARPPVLEVLRGKQYIALPDAESNYRVYRVRN